MLTAEERWLDYAWSIVTCPAPHRDECESLGAAVPGPGRVDGNDVRWPGYLGREYREGAGILCVGAVHREARPEDETSDPVIAQTNAELAAAHRRWLRRGRSRRQDQAFIEAVRDAYERALPRWSRWNRHFRTLVEDHLGASPTEVAWTNLAKCRVSIHRGATARSAEAALTRLCQRDFAPMSELVEAIRPAIVLTSVLHAGRDGDIVTAWDAPSSSPVVFSWQGQSGHDRHNRDPHARRLSVWAPEAAAAYRARIKFQRSRT